MVERAISDNHCLRVTDVEFHMPRPSYTIFYTLTYLSEKHPQKEFRLIIGEDNLESFAKWKNWQLILNNYGLMVYPRPKSSSSDLKQHPKVSMVDAPLVGISATFYPEIHQRRKVH